MAKVIGFQLKSMMRHDAPASLTVFFVALPLCLGIALASGAPASSGIISGIVGGLIVTLISHSALSVTGPAAGLSTLVAAGIATAGTFDAFLPAVIIAGGLQLLLGALRIGGFVSFIPTSVIKGMLGGIGILIVGKQIPVALGMGAADFWSLVGALDFPSISRSVTLGVLGITLLSLVLLIALPRIARKLIRYFPVPLLVVIVAISVSAIFHGVDPSLALKNSQLVQMPADFSTGLVFPAWNVLLQPSVWKTGIVVGLVASLETLLCVEAIDKLDPHRRTTPVNRELIAQGSGNLVCGLLGGIPMTAVIVRGAANIQAGAQSRASSFMHGLLLLLSALFLVSVINRIPLAALAAILFVTGYNLCSVKKIREVWRLGLSQFMPFAATVLIVVGVDLLIGVLTGILTSCYFILYRTFKTDYDTTTSRSGESAVLEIKLHRNVTFLNKIRLKNLLGAAPEYSIVRIDGTQTQHIDYDVLEMLAEYSITAHDRHIQFELSGVASARPAAVH